MTLASNAAMKHPLFAALLLLTAAPAYSQSAPPPPPQVPNYVAALREAALADNYAWEITEGLTTEVGQRMAGTEAEARARNWAVAKLKSMGFSNVRVEPFDMPIWTRGPESAEILAPFPQKLVVAALGNSGSTPPGGITGEVVGFEDMAALDAAPDEAVRGKIVFVSHGMARTQDGSSLRRLHRSTRPRADRCQPQGRVRQSSSARSAPTITATRIPAVSALRTAPGQFQPARCRFPTPSSSSASSSAASR